MKHFRILSAAVIALFSVLFFSACTTNDDEVLPQIIGLWKSEAVDATGEEATQDGTTILSFAPDMTIAAAQTTSEGYEWLQEASYHVDGAHLVISYTDRNYEKHAVSCLFHIEDNTMYLSHFSEKGFSDMTLVRQ